MYDIFYVGSKSDIQWHKFKQNYPAAKCAESVTNATQKSLTKHFWIVYADTEIQDNFAFDYTPDEWSQDVAHVFLNDKEYDGIVLLPKTHNYSDKEIQNRFYVTHKKVEIVASKPAKYEIFYADTYEEYVEAFETSQFDMFYIVPNYVNICNDYKFDFYISHHNPYDKKINHMFLNGEHHDGVMLCSKKVKISEREWTFKFIA